MYSFVGTETVHSYPVFVVGHYCPWGSYYCRNSAMVCFSFSQCVTFLLWLLINLLSMYFCLKNTYNLCSLRECFSTLAPLFLTLLLFGGSSHIIFHFLCSLLLFFSKTMDFGSIAFPDIQILFNASWYSSFTNSNFCLSDEFLQSNLHNDISNLFRISDGWFDNISQQLGVILLSVKTICVFPYVKCVT